MNIREGVHLISGKISNVYLSWCPQNSSYILIDTGLAQDFNLIRDYFQDQEIAPNQIDKVVLTTADLDHSGAASKIKDNWESPVYISDKEKARLKDQDNPKRTKFAAKMAEVSIHNSVTPDHLLRDGERIGDLKVLVTPGHSRGSICLYHSEERLLFTGDTLRTGPSGKLMFPTPDKINDLSALQESLARLSDLEVETLLPGHGQPVISGAAAKIDDLIATFSGF